MISELTGLTSITLIGGVRPVASNGEEADCLVASVHYGATVERLPRNFAEFDEESFRRNFVGSFEKYINCTEDKQVHNITSWQASTHLRILSSNLHAQHESVG